MPNTGPSDGSRRHSSGFLPIAPRPWVSETAVVVLPSPAFVGVTPATQTTLASGVSRMRSTTPSETLALKRPYGSNSSGSSPARSAIVSIGACVANFNGTKYLRPIDKQAGQICKTGEKPVNWNQKGPKGDIGPQGPAGPKGSGVGAIVQKSGSANIAPGATSAAVANCPAGMRAVGGGYLVLGDRKSLTVVGNAPTEDGKAWEADARND